MRQLDLFEAKEKSRDFWEMSGHGVSDAASVLIEMLREGHEVVTFSKIVKRKMNLTGDTVPDALARTFADGIEAVCEERLRIKEAVEDAGEFNLCVVDNANRSVLRGGYPYAFSHRRSVSGQEDESVQTQMTIAKLAHAANRRVRAGLLSQEDSSEMIDGVRGLLSTASASDGPAA
jgi:hypothetical protein